MTQTRFHLSYDIVLSIIKGSHAESHSLLSNSSSSRAGYEMQLLSKIVLLHIENNLEMCLTHNCHILVMHFAEG